ncbi:MAG TPA: preprotein translocase subunit YajC [Nocardioides sp.]|nr:preprotein translocase subunit YajC [Nocardioides sp.]
MPELVSLLPIVGIAFLFWFLIIRPASKRQRELSRMQGSLEIGEDVMLSSGIFGTLAALDGDNVHLVVADGVTIKVARAAVANVVRTETAADEPGEG